MQRTSLLAGVLIAAMTLPWSTRAPADVPMRVSFSAILGDGKGEPLSGPVTLELGIWDQATGGNALYEEIQIGAEAGDGRVTAELGEGIATDRGSFSALDETVLAKSAIWLQIGVNGETLAPRLAFTSVALTVRAQVANDADRLGGFAPEVFLKRIAQACPTGSAIRAVAADGTVACAPDAGDPLQAGKGLLLDGTTFSIDAATVQLRVLGACPPGAFIRSIDAAGNVACDPDGDTDTTSTAGPGLTLENRVFATDPSVVQQRVLGTCPAGEVMQVISADGTVACTGAGDGDIEGVVAGAGLLTTGCDAGSCSLTADPTVVQARIGSCPPGSGLTGVAADGTPACAALINGTVEALTTSATSGLQGGCTSGTCNLAINDVLVQRRITTSCASDYAMRAVQANGTATCAPIFDGDIDGIATPAGSGLSGGCTQQTCALELVPSAFLETRFNEETTSLGRRIDAPLPDGESVFMVTRGFRAPRDGTVLAIASAHAVCTVVGCSNGTAAAWMLLTTDRDEDIATQPEARLIEATTNDWTSIAAQRTFPVTRDEQILVYWRAASLVPGFTDPTIRGARLTLLFMP